jgi:hypothetical protein
MGDHVNYTVGSGFDCCPDDHPTDRASVGATCCDFTQASPLRADYVHHAAPVVHDALMAADVPFFTVVPPVAPNAPCWLDSRPPPLPLADRLAGIRTFLI